VRLERVTGTPARRFAGRIGIVPGIVAGRLQHDNLRRYPQGNQLKRPLSFPPAADDEDDRPSR
jgi:hypothetical protein